MLDKARIHEADLEYKRVVEKEGDEAEDKAGRKRLQRKYFTPTEANWGPKPRATGG